MIADTAVRELDGESIGAPSHPLIHAYVLIHPQAPRRRRGRSDADNLLRNIVVAVLVANGRERWPHLRLTRNDETEGPCVSWAIAAACWARGIEISEARTEDVYGLYADLMPEHVKWLAIHDPDFLSLERVVRRHKANKPQKKLPPPI